MGLQCRYSKSLHARPTEARAFLVNQGYESRHDQSGIITFSPVPQPAKVWTDEEDDLLLKLREGDALEWEQIATSFPGRTARGTERRYKKLARKLLKQDSGKAKRKKKPKILQRRYSEKEDELIIKLREEDKLSWQDIAVKFPDRNAMALQKRYVRELVDHNRGTGVDPLAEGEGGFVFRSNPLKFSRYIAEEDKMLLHLRDDLGLHWSEIEKRMPGRRSQSLENRYQYILQKGNIEKAQIGDVIAPKAGNTLQSNRQSDRQTSLHRDPTAAADGAHSEDELNQDPEVLISMPSFSGSTPQCDVPNGVQTSTNKPTGGLETPPARPKISTAPNGLHDGLAGPGRPLDHYVAQPQSIARSPALRDDSVGRVPQPLPSTGIAGSAQSAPVAFGSKSGARWTQEELELVTEYRNQGMSWPDIGDRMPGRSHRAIRTFTTIITGDSKSTSRYACWEARTRVC